MKVMLVDDHSLFLEGLHYMLETYKINVVGTAKDGLDALVKARALKPDIILMDIRMPGYSGLDLLRLIKAEMPDIKVIMLTTSDEDEDLFSAMKYGAAGYLLKNINADELVGMLSDAYKGGVPLSPGLASRILNEFGCDTADDNTLNSAAREKREARLTGKQLEILKMVARGIKYKEIGAALGLTERTVKYHMDRIIELLHLENRAQVIAYAARTGMITGKGANG
jgi:DNA-binding NarL/FixJ family response regulator